MILLSPRVWGTDTLIAEVPRYVKHDCQCDLASVYKNLGSKTQSSAIDFTTGGFYQYCSRPVGGSPSNSLEQPRPGNGFEGRHYHQGLQNLAATEGGILNIQTVHGSNSITDATEPAQAATTTFIADAGVVRAAESHSKGPTLGLAKKSQIKNVEDIKKFLAKPISLLTGSFASADTVSTFSRIEAMTTITSQALVADKLRGFAGIRATIVFTIVVNGNRFQQGRYMFCWVPMGGVNTGTTRSLQYYNSHIATLTQRTQLHRVEIDVNCDTEAELVVPFSSALNWFPLSKSTGSGMGEVGYFSIFPYVPLTSSGGSTQAYFKIYAHLEDVELFGATVPQMGRRATSRVVKKTASELEAKNAKVGPVESVMSTLTDVSNALSVVPLLTPFAAPASWVFEALTGVAATFGWSKPPHLAPAHRIVRQHAPYMGSINNDDYSLPLSLDVSNAVEAIPDLGFTDSDEMDFLSITSIPSYFTQATWSTTDTNGTALLTLNANPSAYSTSVSGYTHYTPLSFVASFFNYWRGSINFKFKIVKTEFHSGRLNIAFSPSNAVGSFSTTFYANSPYLERRIYDIRECNEIIVNVPYSCALPYLDTKSSGGSKTSSTGNLYVWVEDQLVAPANVTSNVTILVEVYGGDDIEFAFPATTSLTPVYGIVPQMGERVTRNDCRLDNTELTMSTAKDQVEAASKCIGERIRSFRALLKSYCSMPNTAGNSDASAPTLLIYPFVSPGYLYSATTPVTPQCLSDLYGTLNGVYTYSRGGVRWALQIRDEGTEPTVLPNDNSTLVVRQKAARVLTDVWTPTSAFGAALDAIATNGLKVISDTSDGNLVQVGVSAYMQSFTRLCSEQIVFPTAAGLSLDTDSAAVLAQGDTLLIGNTTGNDVANNRRWAKFRAGADDADFAQFVSIMPMIKLTPT